MNEWEHDHIATPAEADREYAENVGRDNPKRAWILSDRDVWYRNPFYSGPPVPHPEDYCPPAAEPDPWFYDPGAIPGEAMFLLHYDPKDETSMAGIIEEEQADGSSLFAAYLPDGELVGRFPNPDAAKEATDKRLRGK